MTKNKKGFTIIEVVLVLAIAGLIFLMVFIALPAMQRSQRNTRRRQDMARILSAFTDYQAANGRMPFKVNGHGGMNDIDENFVIKYIEPNLKMRTKEADPSRVGGWIYYDCKDGESCEHFQDPDGTIYDWYVHNFNYGYPSGWTDHEFSHRLETLFNAKCGSEENTLEKENGVNNIVVVYVLEGNAEYCGDNQ